MGVLHMAVQHTTSVKLGYWPRSRQLYSSRLAQQATCISKLALLISLVACGGVQAVEKQAVGFDVPAIVVAQQVDPLVVQQPQEGGKFIRLRFPVSTFTTPDFSGEITEYVVHLECPYQSMRIIDFWPRDEVYSQIAGNVAVESKQQTDSELQLGLSAGIEPVGRGTASGTYSKNSSVLERYERLPPLQTLTSSGTIHRGSGVFFKFRPGPSPDLEGSRELAILAEVSEHWRADMLLVTMQAAGKASKSSYRRGVINTTRLWMTVHQEGDMAAAAQARRFLTQERSLRALAASRQQEVDRKAMPTLLHRIGAALDVVEPRIPGDYLRQVIFGPRSQYLEGDSHRLPLDLRIAILDYWEQRDAMAHLALGSALTES